MGAPRPNGQVEGSSCAPNLTKLTGMNQTDQPEPPANAEASALEAEMDSELGELRSRTPGSGGKPLNPVFQHEQRAGTAEDEAEATLTAARASGAMGAEADQERLKIEGLVKEVEAAAPGSARANDAAAAEAQAEKDADEAIAASLDSDTTAEDARSSEGSGLFHRSANPEEAGVDNARALADESVVGKDLSDLDALVKRVSDDVA